MTDTQYYSLITSSGHQANIKAKALGLPIVISKVAFGSGNITPIESATALVKEEIRVNINSIVQNETDKNILEIEAVIPSDVGGFLVNEVALYLEDGTLYAVANLPASYKPSLDQGAGKEFAFTIFLASVGVENVTLKIDDSIVFATRKYVQNELKKYAFKNGDKTQIFKVKDAVEDDEAVNKKQLNEHKDVETATKLATARNITVGNATKSFDGSANITFSLAEIGAGVIAGNNASNGYVKLSNGLILQWGHTSGNTSSIIFPIAFPTNVLNVQISFTDLTGGVGYAGSFSSSINKSKNGFSYGITEPIGRFWFAIGY